LSAKLHFIAKINFRLSMLVLDDIGLRNSIFVFRKFDDIRLPYEAKAKRVKSEAAGNTNIAAALRSIGIMYPVMHLPSPNGENILLPLLFQVDQSPLTLAKDKVLQGGDGEKFVFGVHEEWIYASTGTTVKIS